MIDLYKVVRTCGSALFCAKFSESSAWFCDLTGADLHGLLLFGRIREQKRGNSAIRGLHTHAHAGPGIGRICVLLKIICPTRTFFNFHVCASQRNRARACILPSEVITTIHGECSNSTRKGGSNAIRSGSTHARVCRFTVFAIKRYPSHVLRPCPAEQFHARSTLCFGHLIVHRTARTGVVAIK